MTRALTQRQRDAKFRASPRGRFYVHRWNAWRRGVSFLLTFEEWWAIWEKSGHWQDRGNKKGKYVMCRIADAGAYSKGNVFIAKMEANVYERNHVYGPPGKPREVRL